MSFGTQAVGTGTRAAFQMAADTASSSAAETFMHGQVGNELFRIHDYDDMVSLLDLDGPPQAAAFIRFPNGAVQFGTLQKGTEPVEQAVSGVRAIFKGKTEWVDRPTIKFRPDVKGTPVKPPDPTQGEIIAKNLKILTEKAENLTKSAQSLGTRKQQALGKAQAFQAKAQEYLGHAREFLRAGDKDNAINALYKVVSASQAGDEFNAIAKVIAGEQSDLMKQVAQFRTGLEKVAMTVDVTSARLEAAQASQAVKREMTGLGTEAKQLKEAMAGLQDELATTTADNAAMDEAMASGQVDSLFGDPLAARASQASADDAVLQLLAQLEGTIATEARDVGAQASGGAIGAVSEQVAETVAGQTMAAGR